jgi:hypothetical protein
VDAKRFKFSLHSGQHSDGASLGGSTILPDRGEGILTPLIIVLLADRSSRISFNLSTEAIENGLEMA